jgi:hypothetical protein
MQKMLQRIVTVAALWLLLPASLCAQWLAFKTPGIPRTPDGKPDLTAPTPRTVDGHPDLSGLWAPRLNFYWLDIIQNIKDETIFKPEAAALFQKRATEYNLDGPVTRCLPLGPGDIFLGWSRIMQSPAEVAVLQGGLVQGYREIFLDRRELSKDPDPTWRGYSVGRWNGDTLAVETAGFNDTGRLDQVGHPRSEKLHVTERFRRVDFGHMQFEIIFDDPVNLTKPLTISLQMNYMPDASMMESVCNENEKDRTHFVASELKPRIQLSATDLAKYEGVYEPGNFVISLVNNQLYLWDIPLFPQSKTIFESRFSEMEFSLDSTGAVTSVDLIGENRKAEKSRDGKQD